MPEPMKAILRGLVSLRASPHSEDAQLPPSWLGGMRNQQPMDAEIVNVHAEALFIWGIKAPLQIHHN